ERWRSSSSRPGVSGRLRPSPPPWTWTSVSCPSPSRSWQASAMASRALAVPSTPTSTFLNIMNPGAEVDPSSQAYAVGSVGHDARAVRVLTVTAGSSSRKLRLLDDEDVILAQQELALEGAQIEQPALAAALDSPLADAEAVGHRIVHGGEQFRSAVKIEPHV